MLLLLLFCIALCRLSTANAMCVCVLMKTMRMPSVYMRWLHETYGRRNKIQAKILSTIFLILRSKAHALQHNDILACVVIVCTPSVFSQRLLRLFYLAFSRSLFLFHFACVCVCVALFSSSVFFPSVSLAFECNFIIFPSFYLSLSFATFECIPFTIVTWLTATTHFIILVCPTK